MKMKCPPPKWLSAKELLCFGNMPSQYTREFVPLFYVDGCQWLMLVLGDCLFFKGVSGVKGSAYGTMLASY
jgi:hypothetical protein